MPFRPDKYYCPDCNTKSLTLDVIPNAIDSDASFVESFDPDENAHPEVRAECQHRGCGLLKQLKAGDAYVQKIRDANRTPEDPTVDDSVPELDTLETTS